MNSPSKLTIILVSVIVILSLALIERQATVRELKTDYDYFDSVSVQYNARINELNQIIIEIQVEKSYFDSVAHNVSKEEQFLTTASPHEILTRYDQNKQSLGGN